MFAVVQGFLGVNSAGRGHGSTFFFELPVFGPDYRPLAEPQTTLLETMPAPQQQQQPLNHLSQPKPAHHGATPPRLLLKPSSIACADESGVDHRSHSDVALGLDRPADDFPLAVPGMLIYPTVEHDGVAGRFPFHVLCMRGQPLNGLNYFILGLGILSEQCDNNTPLPLRIMIVVCCT